MTTKQAPAWAISKIDDIPADAFIKKLDEQLEEARRAYRVMHQTYQMTGNPGFFELARQQSARIRGFEAIIQENLNLYYILTKNMSLN